jgi:hypothetical protein
VENIHKIVIIYIQQTFKHPRLSKLKMTEVRFQEELDRLKAEWLERQQVLETQREKLEALQKEVDLGSKKEPEPHFGLLDLKTLWGSQAYQDWQKGSQSSTIGFQQWLGTLTETQKLKYLEWWKVIWDLEQRQFCLEQWKAILNHYQLTVPQVMEWLKEKEKKIEMNQNYGLGLKKEPEARFDVWDLQYLWGSQAYQDWQKDSDYSLGFQEWLGKLTETQKLKHLEHWRGQCLEVVRKYLEKKMEILSYYHLTVPQVMEWLKETDSEKPKETLKEPELRFDLSDLQTLWGPQAYQDWQKDSHSHHLYFQQWLGKLTEPEKRKYLEHWWVFGQEQRQKNLEQRKEMLSYYHLTVPQVMEWLKAKDSEKPKETLKGTRYPLLKWVAWLQKEYSGLDLLKEIENWVTWWAKKCSRSDLMKAWMSLCLFLLLVVTTGMGTWWALQLHYQLQLMMVWLKDYPKADSVTEKVFELLALTEKVMDLEIPLLMAKLMVSLFHLAALWGIWKMFLREFEKEDWKMKIRLVEVRDLDSWKLLDVQRVEFSSETGWLMVKMTEPFVVGKKVQVKVELMLGTMSVRKTVKMTGPKGSMLDLGCVDELVKKRDLGDYELVEWS